MMRCLTKKRATHTETHMILYMLVCADLACWCQHKYAVYSHTVNIHIYIHIIMRCNVCTCNFSWTNFYQRIQALLHQLIVWEGFWMNFPCRMAAEFLGCIRLETLDLFSSSFSRLRPSTWTSLNVYSLICWRPWGFLGMGLGCQTSMVSAKNCPTLILAHLNYVVDGERISQGK